ncbi:MAG: flagellar motor protein MotB, partial [Mangrovicoccus sp.]
MSSESLAPIIINKKIEEAGEGHHGGAWKVAYADFVTAMMAFFLLMWLLNATTEKQRKGLADYFSPSIPVHKVSGGGDGQFWGDNVFADEVLAQSGTGAAMEKPTSENQAKGSTGVELAKQETPSQAQKNMAESEHLLEQLQLRGGESMAQLMDLRHVVSRITDEGVVFDVFALPGEPLFWPGTNEPTEVMLEVARLLSEIINLAANDIAVNAHLASLPVMVREYP